jgi:UDP-GlcNAc:undecaprenyl-phosphate GlcNAc-1-phosphate transferase
VKSSTTVAIFVPLVALGLPIIDTLFAMIRRVLERRSIFSADLGHIHHRLLAMGIDHRRAVLILYGLSILFTAGAILLSLGRNWQVGVALFVLSVAVVGVVRAMGNVHASLERSRRNGDRTSNTDLLRTAVPIALHRIAVLNSRNDLASVLSAFGQAAGLREIDLAGCEPTRLEDFRWTTAVAPNPAGTTTGVLRESFPLAAAGGNATLSFTWDSDAHEIAAEQSILFRLVAEASNSLLDRLNSAPDKNHLRAL